MDTARAAASATRRDGPALHGRAYARRGFRSMLGDAGASTDIDALRLSDQPTEHAPAAGTTHIVLARKHW